MPSNALNTFTQLIGYVDQLIHIHGRLQAGPGRRHEQDALHRAGVVMTVAAWESYIERLVMEGLGAIEHNAGVAAGAAPAAPVPAWARHAFALRRAEIANSVKRFNTPKDSSVRDLLLESLEFNPWPHWNWHAGPRQWAEADMRRRVNEWMDVRHSVAHGFALPTNIQWIQDAHHRPRLTLGLLNECRAFFTHLAEQTDAALSMHLHNHHGIPVPW